MDSLTEMYCLVDDFCQGFEPAWEQRLLTDGSRKRRRVASLSLAELMTLVILFHQTRHRQFKTFYLGYVRLYLQREFPTLPSYPRCVELMPRCAVALAALFETLKGRCTGISIADSTPIAVCHNLRIGRHRVFAGRAARGKSSTGWFFGFKLHAVINHVGELLAIRLTPGNVDDRKPLRQFVDRLFGKLYADKGYLAKWLTAFLQRHGVDLITKLKKRMQPVPRSAFDDALLRRRSLIETVFGELKNLCQIQHTRHRSPANFVVNLLAGIVAYCLMPNKPHLPLTCARTLDYQPALIPN